MCITTSKKLEFFSHRGKRQKLVQIRQFIYLIEKKCINYLSSIIRRNELLYDTFAKL